MTVCKLLTILCRRHLYTITLFKPKAIDLFRLAGLALETLRTVGFTNDRPGVPDIAIVLTDGLSSDPVATKVQVQHWPLFN